MRWVQWETDIERERGLWGRMDERKMDWGDLKIKLQEANHMIVRGPRLWLMQFTHSHRFTTGRSAWLHSMGFSAWLLSTSLLAKFWTRRLILCNFVTSRIAYHTKALQIIHSNRIPPNTPVSQQSLCGFRLYFPLFFFLHLCFYEMQPPPGVWDLQKKLGDD